jgi:dolichyl-phosphate-mannose--protein O-mannosyl transferase
MSRRGVNRVVQIVIALALAIPFAAGVASANNSKTTSTTMDILMTVSLNGKQLKPGTYTVTAGDSKVTLAQNGKVVAEAPVQWKDETSKPQHSNIVTTGEQVTEIHFSGKMRYVTVGPVESKLN